MATIEVKMFGHARGKKLYNQSHIHWPLYAGQRLPDSMAKHFGPSFGHVATQGHDRGPCIWPISEKTWMIYYISWQQLCTALPCSSAKHFGLVATTDWDRDVWPMIVTLAAQWPTDGMCVTRTLSWPSWSSSPLHPIIIIIILHARKTMHTVAVFMKRIYAVTNRFFMTLHCFNLIQNIK